MDSGVADCDRFLFSAEKDRPISLSWGTKDVDYLWGNDYTWIPCGIERRDGDTFFESKSNCDEDLSLALQFELGHGPDDQLNTCQGTGSQGWSWTLQSQGGDHESRFEESFYSLDDVMHTARSFAQNFQQIVRHLWDDAYTWMKHSKGSETINCIDSVLQDGMIMDVNNACNEEISSSMTREFEPLRFGDGASQSMQVVTNRNWIYNRDDGEMGSTPLRHSEFSVSNHLYNLKTQSVVSGEEDNLDLFWLNFTMDAQSSSFTSGRGVNMGPSWLEGNSHQSKVKKARKQISFSPSVDIHLFNGDRRWDGSVCSDQVDVCFRSLWHLHGQIAAWDECVRVVSFYAGVNVALQTESEGVFESASADEQLAEVSTSEMHLNRAIASLDTRRRTHWFIDTWFLAFDRYHLCIRPRKVQIQQQMTYKEFLCACRKTWADLDDGSGIEPIFTNGGPSSLPSILANVILVQAETTGHSAILLHTDSLPTLMRNRAVLFQQGSTVTNLFQVAQFEEACAQRVFRCFVQQSGSQDAPFHTNDDHMVWPHGTYLEGGIREIVENDLQRGHDDTLSGASTTTSITESDSDDDTVSWMSTSPVQFFHDPPNPPSWLAEDYELGEEEIYVEPEVPDIAYAPQHQGHLQDEIEQLLDGSDADDTLWIAATFGLGLVDLGRRDVEFSPYNLPGLLNEILRVCEDHSRYGNLVVFNVHPQPIDVVGQRAVALLVVVEMPEALDPTIRNALIIEQAAEDVPKRPQPYAARLTCETSQREVLAHLNLHLPCLPFALRPCHVRLGTLTMEKDAFYDFDHGTLCRTWIGAVFEQVLHAEQSITDAEPFFCKCNHSLTCVTMWTTSFVGSMGLHHKIDLWGTGTSLLQLIGYMIWNGSRE